MCYKIKQIRFLEHEPHRQMHFGVIHKLPPLRSGLQLLTSGFGYCILTALTGCLQNIV